MAQSETVRATTGLLQSLKQNTDKGRNVQGDRPSSEAESSSVSSLVKKVVVKLPAKFGPLNITSPEQVIQLLKTKSDLQIAPQTVTDSTIILSQGAQPTTADSKNTQLDTYKCTLCEYTSHNKHYLKQHVELVHLAERPYKCPFCDYAGKRSHSLKEHLVVHSSYRPYECHFCNATFRKKGHLTHHIKLHASLSQSTGEQACKLCGITFQQVSNLWAHMHKSHKDTPGLLTCGLCQFVTVDQSEFKIHWWYHGKEKVHQCTACEFVCDKELTMMEHIAEEHNGRASCTVQRPSRPDCLVLLKCSECGFSTADKDVLREHMFTHLSTEDQETLRQSMESSNATAQVEGRDDVVEPVGQALSQAYECQCGFLAPSEEEMISHVNSAHGQILMADTSAMTKEQASSSSSMTSAVVLMKCSECGFTAKDQAAMKSHMMVHLPQFVQQSQGTEKSSAGAGGVIRVESPSHQGKPSEGDQPTTTVYNCAQCKFSSSEAYVFITHMLTHRPMVKSSSTGQGSRFQVPVSSTAADLHEVQHTPGQSCREYVHDVATGLYRCAVCGYTCKREGRKLQHPHQQQPRQDYVHDMALGVYRCAICSYTCEHQRTIKAHIWKHSGHKDIDYPMFQNGPLSMFDYTPIGMTKLAAGKSVIAEPKREQLKRAKGDQAIFVMENLPSGSSGESERRSTVNLKTIASAKTIVDGHSKQVILVPAKSVQQQERAALLQVNEPAQKNTLTSQQQPQSNLALKNLLGSRQEVLLAPVSKSDQTYVTVEEVVHTSHVEIIAEGSRKRAHPASGEENVVPAKKSHYLEGVNLNAGSSPAHVVVEPMSDMYTTPTVNFVTLYNNKSSSPRSQSPRHPDNNSTGCTNSPEAPINTNCDEPETESLAGSQQSEDAKQAKAELQAEEVIAMETLVEDVVLQQEDEGSAESPQSYEEVAIQEYLQVEEAGCVEVHTSQEDTHSTASSDASETLATERDTASSKLVDDIAKEQALTLLSLLKKGPNFNPACPPPPQLEAAEKEEDPAAMREHNKARLLDHSYRGRKSGGSKSGISHSLLAAIEHLRQVSKSESEEEEGGSSGSLSATSSVKRKRGKAQRGGRRRSRRKVAAPEGSPIDANKNVETLARDRLRCKLCHYTTTSATLMKTHMRVHKAKNATECTLCDFVSRDSEELQQHILQHCKVRTYQCRYCSSEFSYKSQLRAHMRAHDDRHPLLCESCEYQTWDLLAYQKHIEFCKSAKSICTGCGQKFCSRDELEKHKDAANGGTAVACDGRKGGEHRCEHCDFSTESEESYNKHLRWHGRTYKCEQCDFVCTNYKGMANHSRVHFEEKEQRCQFCDFVAKSVRSLKSHMKRHANDQRFVQQPLEQYMCNLCGYMCHHLPSLKSHMWRHASDTSYSYTSTNEVINAAIDYDSAAGSAAPAAADKEKEACESKEATDQQQEEKNAVNSFITFCCCQCGFESTDKAELNSHMKVHNDIIQKTLAVNMGRFAIQTSGRRGSGSGAEDSEAEKQVAIITQDCK